MTPVAHLLDHDADFQTRALARILAGDDIEFVGRDFLSAARRLRKRNGEILHAWGRRSLLAAALANRGPVVYTPTFPVRLTPTPWLNWICKKRNVQVVCDSAELRELMCMNGLPPDRCRLIPPAVDFSLKPGGSHPPAFPDQKLRRKLGLADDDFAVLAPGETNHSSGHALALWAVAMAYETSKNWKFLVWGRGPMSSRLQRQAVNMGVEPMTRFAPDLDFQDFVAAADAATATAEPAAGALPLAMCMAAGLPIAGNPDETSRKIALDLVKLRSDDELRKSRGDAARANAAKLFNAEQYRRAHAELYSGISRRVRIADRT
jgi:glycosyltransferase involved in cell wall biosynthesis